MSDYFENYSNDEMNEELRQMFLLQFISFTEELNHILTLTSIKIIEY